MSISRRDFLRHTSAGVIAASLPLAGCGDDDPGSVCELDGRGLGELPETLPELESYVHEGALGPESLFSHGVASGDPLPDRVILWTRVSPEAPGETQVFWEIALDPEFTQRLNAGWATTSEVIDYTVKVDAAGLVAGRAHYYRFWLEGRSSPIGRTKTAPLDGAAHLRFGVVSCSSYAHGHFHVYEHLAARPDLDAILHLGDYIYEYGTSGYDPDSHQRLVEPAHETVTLEDYRIRYAQYRRDPKLQAVHRQHPFVCVWDDHESANDSWRDGAQNHDPETEGDWEERKAAAQQAYDEWMPIRSQTTDVIYRKLRFGDLCELLMLDTRLFGRDEQLGGDAEDSPDRTLLGYEQEEWLEESLLASNSRWKLLGQQVMMAPLTLNGTALNLDQWDGYEGARERLLGFIEDEGIEDVVVLTGDIHTSWANDVPSRHSDYDAAAGRGSVVTEFVTPAVTSPGIPGLDASTIPLIQNLLPDHIKYVDVSQRGYIVLDVTSERVQGDWFHIDGVREDEGNQYHAASWEVRTGDPHLREKLEPVEVCDAAPLAP